MATEMKTPGVYIVEKNAFPNAVIQVPTAVPVFVGYTHSNTYQGKSLQNAPTRISSFADYVAYFCNNQQPATCQTVFTLATTPTKADITIANINYSVTPQANTLFYMYNSIQLFFQNGGGTCYILSVGTYDKEGANGPSIKHFYNIGEKNLNVFNLLENESEPTLVLIPDALLFSTPADYYTLMNDCITHCNNMQSRMALIDVYIGNAVTDITTNPIDQLRSSITVQCLNYAAAYYPFVNTMVVSNNQINASNVAGGFPASFSPTDVANLTQVMLTKVNCLPATPAVAGCITTVDNTQGVWRAPANIALNAVTTPTVKITDDMQSGMNVDALTGKSVNAIRNFNGRGTLIWGARTLDGNSEDWRYINVRRTMIMIEQSIKLATKAYVFEPNVANTWLTIKSTITNFLTGIWTQGGLMGSTPADAFSISVGLGSTMSSDDILEGILRVTVLVALTHPAEFIEITFQQQMQKS